MGRIIRRTVTITITESWTIVWTDEAQADDKPQPPATTIVQDQPKPQEEEDEMILPAVKTGIATDAQPTCPPSQAVNANAPAVEVQCKQRST